MESKLLSKEFSKLGWIGTKLPTNKNKTQCPNKNAIWNLAKIKKKKKYVIFLTNIKIISICIIYYLRYEFILFIFLWVNRLNNKPHSIQCIKMRPNL